MQSMTNDSQFHFHKNDMSLNHLMYVVLLPRLNASYNMMIVVMSKSDIGKRHQNKECPTSVDDLHDCLPLSPIFYNAHLISETAP